MKNITSLYPNKQNRHRYAKLKYGQRFLVNERYIDMEVSSASINSSDRVLEIGGGTGNLTEKLIEKTDKVTVIEKDPYMVEYLKKRFRNSTVKIIEGDFLEIDLSKYRIDKIVSNIPYNLSSPILYRIYTMKFESAVIIFQKEFADRLTAHTGSKDYSRLTVTSYLHADIYKLFDLPADAFDPPPEVRSTAVKIIPVSERSDKVLSEEFTDQFIRVLFMHRRKKIRTILKDYMDMETPPEFMQYPDMRVEQIEPEEIIKLSNSLYRKKIESH
ncbi:MAG: 16S rRNA (adenine(1518)-N(6)/adenine(1519)-N(6))-dimethyltransferase RsmA [Candidatus Thermoplasmatota archaeon]|jgi:16S rRNA (adenine1518-N6/adenine1519-N6)-dimethyltransferase|nr:16S rRNA (adenine(1518)-N(6)/adenine(1519)-N(6))-dimethyltransferase RsmA [Candidatus Thermoplasmatota archaeon]MCL5963470.1 16S rRNA (adenine(1518)-N(6)/adenine(1519)-N(6))-dimethyltransferase RsmA [Candidatus Thermoplasmatota archaeon]